MSSDDTDDFLADFLDEGDYLEEVPGDEAVDPEASQGTAHQFSPFGNGSFLILSGPGAGSVVATPPDGAVMRSAPSVPSRDEALDGGRPLLLIHRPHHGSDVIPRLLAHVHTAGDGDMALGVVLPISSVSDQSRQRWAAACPTAAVRIADPRGFMLDPTCIRLDDEPISARAAVYAPYLTTMGAPDWAAQVLDAQRAAGANLLLTSGRALNVGSPQLSLDAAFDEGDDALAELREGERLALNLTMSSQWLASSTLREALFAELIDREQFDTLYVRVQWRGGRAHGQPLDTRLLDGYRELARLAEDEERKLLLPQTGLTGWHLLAFGAKGFGAGIDGSHNAFGEPGGGGGGQPRIERYFENQLLHTVERTAHDALSRDPSYIRCDCTYCPSLFGAGRAWHHRTAGLHFLANLGNLTAQAGGATTRGGARGYVRRSVRAARAFADGKPLTGPNAPSHLSVWGPAL